MLAPQRPFGHRGARFDRDGAYVYFTGENGQYPIAPTSTLRTSVLRVRLSDGEVEAVYPAADSRSEVHAVFLAAHPSGDTVLVGLARGIRADLAATGAYTLTLAEVPARGGTVKELPLKINARSWARYGSDGKHVDVFTPFGTAGIHDPPGGFDVRRIERASGAVSSSERRSVFFDAGDYDLEAFTQPHLGSFGFDGYFTYRLHDPQGARALRFTEPTLELSETPPQPVVFRNGRVLLQGGFEKDTLVLVARCTNDGSESDDASDRRQTGEALQFDPKFLEGAVLAQCADSKTQALLETVARTLRSPGATTPTALRATFVEVALEGDSEDQPRIEAIEITPGQLRVERFRELPPPEEETRAGPTVVSDTVTFDGRRTWRKTEAEDVFEIETRAFCQSANRYSPFRLLLDPAGVGDGHVRFGETRTETEAAHQGSGDAGGGADTGDGNDALHHVPFRYADGFHGTLVLRQSGATVLPERIETPLRFPSKRLRRQHGSVATTKTVQFNAWRSWNGRQVPSEIRFVDGLQSKILALLDLREVEPPDASEFEFPGPSADPSGER